MVSALRDTAASTPTVMRERAFIFFLSPVMSQAFQSVPAPELYLVLFIVLVD
jgi:hypothetical protein